MLKAIVRRQVVQQAIYIFEQPRLALQFISNRCYSITKFIGCVEGIILFVCQKYLAHTVFKGLMQNKRTNEAANSVKHMLKVLLDPRIQN